MKNNFTKLNPPPPKATAWRSEERSESPSRARVFNSSEPACPVGRCRHNTRQSALVRDPRTRKKGFTRTPSLVLSKSGVVGDKKADKKKTNLVCGFTLIESLVGITILLVSVVGPLFIAFQGVSLAYFAKDQIIASYLAQEGIEFVRFRITTNSNMGKVGDELILSGTAYDLSDCSWQSNTSKYCIVDVFNDTITRCDLDAFPGDDCQHIKYDAAAKKYGYTSGTDTLFRRSVVINHNPALGVGDIEFQIESKVEWGKADDEHEITVKEVVRDWRP